MPGPERRGRSQGWGLPGEMRLLREPAQGHVRRGQLVPGPHMEEKGERSASDEAPCWQGQITPVHQVCSCGNRTHKGFKRGNTVILL